MPNLASSLNSLDLSVMLNPIAEIPPSLGSQALSFPLFLSIILFIGLFALNTGYFFSPPKPQSTCLYFSHHRKDCSQQWLQFCPLCCLLQNRCCCSEWRRWGNKLEVWLPHSHPLSSLVCDKALTSIFHPLPLKTVLVPCSYISQNRFSIIWLWKEPPSLASTGLPPLNEMY